MTPTRRGSERLFVICAPSLPSFVAGSNPDLLHALRQPFL